MWTFVFLCILGTNSWQVAHTKTYKVLYAKVIIDKSLQEKYMPTASVINIVNTTWEDLKTTTSCVTTGVNKTCDCGSDHIWSPKVRQSFLCSNETSCSMQKGSNQTCVSNTTVSIVGSITLKGETYLDCLMPPASTGYADCSKKVSTMMKTYFSQLKGFDYLKIINFRFGSIIVDFNMTFSNVIDSTSLIQQAENVTNALQGSLELETKGVIDITVQDASVHYEASANIDCKSKEDLTDLEWYLQQVGQSFKITQGTNTYLKADLNVAHLSILKVNERWEGDYECVLVRKNGNATIYHKAKKKMDVCLEPNIENYTVPSFPLCNGPSLIEVQFKCRIENSTEKYNVTWSSDVTGGTAPDGADTLTYTAKGYVKCNDKSSLNVTCFFINECNQTKSSTVVVNIINDRTDKYCKAELDWENTKADFIAKLDCTGKVGKRQRYCNPNGGWEKETSTCVAVQLRDVLQSANDADTGRGEKQKNVEGVISQFQNVTQSNLIDSAVSLNSSVEVLHVVQNKTDPIQNLTTIHEMLWSSSNLLNDTLNKSWNDYNSDPTGTPIAGKYIIPVEKLIENANISEKIQKPNLEVDTCNTRPCNTSVFNVNITLESSDFGIVKSSGFKNLDGYFPLNNDTEVNSNVVSVTKTNATGDLRVSIDFPLHKPRPRNVRISCVSWDGNNNTWTHDGCKWAGSSQEGRCVCTHLTSFAILMSKTPEDIPELSIITNVGLSLSLLSLVLCLIIEVIVWNDVVKTNTLYLRHVANVNICLSLLIGNICFLSAPEPKETSPVVCKILALLKHFFYLSMFFWTFCLSTTLLHQAVFLFHQVSKKTYLRYSMIVGYVCPFLIVFITFLTTEGSGNGQYSSPDTCWLVYEGSLKGTIFTFIFPMGIIVFLNIFAMLVVIMKLLDHQAKDKGDNDKTSAKVVLKTIVILTPVFGVTWAFGFAVLAFDLTDDVGPAVHYIFTLLNSFQGFFLFLSTYLADKRIRDALLKRFRKKLPASVNESSTKLETTTVKKK